MTDLIEEAIIEKITSTAAIVALIGDRCYLDTLPKDVEYPCIRYFRVSDPPTAMSHDGGPSSLARPRFQFDIFAPAGIDAIFAREQLRIALDGLQETVLDVDIQAAFKDGSRGFYDEATNLYIEQMDFIIWHTQDTE